MDTNDIEPDEYSTRATHIDPTNLHEEFVRLSADLAHWNAKYALAHENYLEADLELDRTEAALHIEWRERLADEGSKVTEGAVKERVQTDQKYIAARIAKIDAEVERLKSRGVVDSIIAKKDMLISLGATVRKEMDGNPRLRNEMRDAHIHG